MSFLTKCLLPRSFTGHLLRPAIHTRLESTKPVPVEQVMVTQLTEESDETEEEKEGRIEKMRNKSRLEPHHRNMLYGRLPYPESKASFHDSVRYKRRAWARYGEESKVYPGIAWPDKEDLEAKKEFEQVLCPLSIQEMVAIEKKKIVDFEKRCEERHASIVEKVKQNDAIVKAFHEKQVKKAKEAEQTKQEKNRLFNEIRQHFGFHIDPHDEKFQEMVEIKKKEEAKKKRQEKKKLREEALIKQAMELDAAAREKDKDKTDINAKKDVETEAEEKK